MTSSEVSSGNLFPVKFLERWRYLMASSLLDAIDIDFLSSYNRDGSLKGKRRVYITYTATRKCRLKRKEVTDELS